MSLFFKHFHQTRNLHLNRTGADIVRQLGHPAREVLLKQLARKSRVALIESGKNFCERLIRTAGGKAFRRGRQYVSKARAAKAAALRHMIEKPRHFQARNMRTDSALGDAKLFGKFIDGELTRGLDEEDKFTPRIG